MSRRLEVELTSRRDDGSWTWRAAGAKQPKGVLDGDLLPAGAGEGDVLRVDAEFEVDGIFVTEVLPPKARSGKPPAERIELIGPPDRGAGTTTTRVSRGRDGRKSSGGGERGRGRSGERDSRGSRRKRQGERRNRDGAADSSGDKPQHRKRREGDGRRRRDSRSKRPAQDAKAEKKPDTPERPPRPKARKLRPGRKHRDALIASLPAEQQVVAEQVVRGGLAAVRTEITEQNRKAAAEGAPEVPAEGVLQLAESLIRPVQIAEWRDRADAAIAGIERVDLRDLRSVLVAAEDFARDADARELTEKIREGLNERVERSQREWHDELRTTLTEGRVVRALRLSSRPPKAGAPLPPEIAQELTSQANAALGTGASQHRIAVVLEAVAYSPVRPYVVLPAIPAEPSDELLEAVRKVASRLPEVATALGIDPTEARPRNQSRRGRSRRSKAGPADPSEESNDTEASVEDAVGQDAAGAQAENATDDAEAPNEPVAEGAADPADTSNDGEDVAEDSADEDMTVQEFTHPA
ncbi:MAG: hypothetical protein F4Z53_13075 [Acidimicrobiales bacterium]|nr:hypothetical protein [Acidimicrobiales bacterium]MYD32827.1 hypothetical protein [Acidimicrobiales bacterium]MYI09070.1 hypothetical protein [Acidimicrobiales bacterium]